MTTYTDAVYSALLTAAEPMSSRAIYDANDTFENDRQVNKAIAQLVKTGRAEMVGTTKPSKGKTVRLYRALTPDEQAERAPSAPADLDQQLAEAIRERDADLHEAVIEPVSAAAPLIGEWPTELDPDGLKHIHRPIGDPIINAMRRMQIGKPRIQGIETDIRRVRSLADTIGDASPDVSGWLNELANKLEYIA